MITVCVYWLAAKYEKSGENIYVATFILDFIGMCCTAGVLTSTTLFGG